MKTNLADVTRASSYWEHKRADELVAALDASGSEGAAHLVDFCRLVAKWWRAGSDPDERRSRWQWIEMEVENFLSSVGPQKLQRLAEECPTLATQISLLTVLTETNVRLRLRPVIETVAERLGREVPSNDPTEASGSWRELFQELLSNAGVTASPAESLAAVLDRAPAWLLAAGFAMLGTLEHYDNFHTALADSLLASRNPALPDAIARALVAGAPVRLGELLALVARKAKSDPRAVALLVAVESALTGADTALRARVVSYWATWRDYEHQTPNLLSAYLNATPANHEDVFDLLTRHGTKPRGRALPTWGLPAITTTTATSMRASSAVQRPGEDVASVHDLPSPDFDAGKVLNSLAPAAVVRLIKAQRDPVFSLEYVTLFSRHPRFVEIATSIAADAECVARWSSVQGRTAAYAWGALENLRLRVPQIETTCDDILRKLLPRLPNDVLARVGMSPLGERLSVELKRLVGQRLSGVRTLSEAEDLIDAGGNLGHFTPNEMLASLNVPALAADADAGGEERGIRVAALGRLLENYPWIGEPILNNMATDRVRDLLETAPQFGPRDYETWPSDTNLALKTRLVRRVASADPRRTAGALAASLDRDIRMLFRARLHVQREDANANPETSPAMQWLDAVDEFAPELTLSYLGALLVSGDVVRDPRERFSIEQVSAWTAAWLGRHDRAAPEELWTLLEKRVVECAASGDLDGIARLAQVALPSPKERIRSYRERAISALKALPAHSYVGRGMRTLRSLLEKEAPDLLTDLPSHPR